MHTRSLWALVLALLFLLPPALLEGQKVPAAERGAWEILGFAGGWDDYPEFDPDGHSWFVHPNKNVLWGAGLNYHLPWSSGPFGFFAGIEGRFVPVDIRPQLGPRAGTVTDMNVYYGNGLFGINLPLHDRFDIYGVGGYSLARWNPEVGEGDWDHGLAYGGGAKIYLLNNLAVFGDYRMHQHPKALKNTTSSVTGLTANETMWGYSVSGGLSFFFGRTAPPPPPPAPAPAPEPEPAPAPAPAPRPTPPPPTPPAPEPEPEVVSYTFEDVYFDFDQATITPEGQARLREVGAILITLPDADIELHGHTDSTGPADYNMGLSQRRAEAVRKYLLDNFSQLRAEQFTIRAFGLTQPVATNDTREGRAQNRRVEIKHIIG